MKNSSAAVAPDSSKNDKQGTPAGDESAADHQDIEAPVTTPSSSADDISTPPAAPPAAVAGRDSTAVSSGPLPPPPEPEAANHTAPEPESETEPVNHTAAEPEPANHMAAEPEQDLAPVPTDQLADCNLDDTPIVYSNYESELQMPEIMRLIQRDLSEPYSIYTYRYFINNWPNLCFLARHAGRIVGAIVCKLDSHDSHTKRAVTSRGYIAMLAVDKQFRKRRIGSCLVLNAIRAMAADAADEVVLETEVTNKGALRLYENLGFVRDKRLFRYYLNGVDALRLKLWLWPP